MERDKGDWISEKTKDSKKHHIMQVLFDDCAGGSDI